MAGTGFGISGVAIAALRFSANGIRRDFSRFERQIAEELVEKQEFVGAYYEADGDDLVPA